MPEFRLEYKKPVPLAPIKRDFITKNEYNTKVKVTDWDRARESYPLDYDAHNPPGGDQHRASYFRLGHGRQEPWITEYLTEYKRHKELLVGPKTVPMLSFGNYIETEIDEKEKFVKSPLDFFSTYQSIMQSDYKMPYPYVMQPLTLPKGPFMEGRRIKTNLSPRKQTSKFLDDCHIDRVKISQKYNGFRYISYNPLTGKYSDGTEVKEKVRQCYPLPYSHVD